jgi:sugar phosphate isomerase/epimerase
MLWRLSLSSWSLHHHLAKGLMDLHDLPHQARSHGIHTVELCHFHIVDQSDDALRALRRSFEDAGAELFGLLLDFGDIASPDEAGRNADVAQLRRWIDIASRLGAARVRVDAGRQPPTPEAVARSGDALAILAEHAATVGVAVSTENFHETAREAQPLLHILDHCNGRVGLCVDFGNADGPDKYATLAALMPRAVSIHCKPRFDEQGRVDRDDLARCLTLAQQHHFAGPMSLINTHRDDEWKHLDLLRAELLTFAA